MKTNKSFKLKTGETIPAGLPVTWLPDSPSRCLVHGDRPEPYRVRITSAFKPPSLATMERWNDDCGCKTIAGDWTEPDGFGPDNCPSWLLALGYI